MCNGAAHMINVFVKEQLPLLKGQFPNEVPNGVTLYLTRLYLGDQTGF